MANDLRRFGKSAGVYDKNGKELCVGDKVRIEGARLYDDALGTIVYGWDHFGIEMNSALDPNHACLDEFVPFADLQMNNHMCPCVQKIREEDENHG